MSALHRNKFCIVCKKQYRYNLFKFPGSTDLRQLWISATQVEPSSSKDSSTRICHIHFDDTSWDQRYNAVGKVVNILKCNAVPSLFVGKDAPTPDPQCSIPPKPHGDFVRCCICSKKTDISRAVQVFNKDEYYSDFGAALSVVLRKSRILMSRYSCKGCSKKVIDCFKWTVEIAVSHMLTTQLLTRHVSNTNPSSRSESDGSDSDVPLNKVEEKLMNENRLTPLNEDFNETCGKCGKTLKSVAKFTDHYVEHVLAENREVYRLHGAGTQADELDVEMGVGDYRQVVFMSREEEKRQEAPDETQVTKRRKGKVKSALTRDTKKQKRAEKESEEEKSDDAFEPEDGIKEEDDGYDNAEDTDFDAPPKESKDVMVQGHVSRKRLTKGEKMRAHEPRMCHLCGIKLKNRRSYLSHLLRHKNPEKFNKTCHLCGKRRVNIAQHIRLCRREMEKNPDGPKERKLPTANCHVCGKKVSGIYLPQHLKRHEMAADIAANGAEALEKYLEKCEICGKKVRNLYIHRYHHKRNKDMPDEDPEKKIRTNYDCDHCGTRFMQRALLVNHLVLKHGMDPRALTQRGNRGMKTIWTCSICKQTFLTYNAIRRHTKQEHNGIGLDLSCETCGKKYNCVAALRFHINTQHLNYFKARCKKCGNYFAEEESLKEHVASRCRAIYGPKRTRSSSARRPPRPPQNEEILQSFDDSKLTHLSAGSGDVMADYEDNKMAPALLDLQMLHGVRMVQEAKLYQQQMQQREMMHEQKMLHDPKMVAHHSKMQHPSHTQPTPLYVEPEHPLYHIPHL